MSQWNNSYAYNNQYQGNNTWNGDMNGQYGNQYYSDRQYDSTSQYVGFDEFVGQMQGGNFNNMQYQNYPAGQYNYQNNPSTSRNNHETYNYRGDTNAASNGMDEYQATPSQPNQTSNPAEPNTYNSDVIFRSNLTPTATEFVPKNSVKPSASNQHIPDSSGSHNSVNSKHNHRSSSGTNWRERPHNSNVENNSRYNGSNRRYNDSNRQEDRSRHQDFNYRNREKHNHSQDHSNNQSQEPTNTQEYNNENRHEQSSRDSSNRYESNRNDRGQSKPNFKSRSKDDRTFYNSAINKSSQDVRHGRDSGRHRHYVGTERLRTDRNVVEDEQYANTYLQSREEKVVPKLERDTHYSPVKQRNKQAVDQSQISKEMTQREHLSEQLDKGTLECLVCCERVKQVDAVWSCVNCYHVLHLRCIRKWAMSSMAAASLSVEGKWRCPACQNPSEDIPTVYWCMCGAVRSPEYQRGSSGAHTCGKSCKRPRSCPHPCTLLCHPGPCPPCQATVNKKCGCGTETRSVLCSSKLAQVCNRECRRVLACTVHYCTKTCHEDDCDPCTETVTQVCYCPLEKSRSVPCTAESGTCSNWSCGCECSRVLRCGAHVCRATCHPPPCNACEREPDAVITCPCGKMKLAKDARKSCTDPVPLCGNICAKPLLCGPDGDKHFCKLDCHEGPCPVCPDKTLLQCRCGHSSREVPCADLPEMYNNVICQKKCNKKLSCGRHRCRTVCCSATVHRCAVVCGRMLSCQLHRCEQFCHTGHCGPCPRVSFEELSCECGAEVLLPPVRCGAKPPACTAPCRRPRDCGHPPHHSCHSGDCPPCVVLTTKKCYGQHEERKTIPCSQEEFSCGLPCGKPLPCGKHTCIKTCHKGPCDTAKCTQPCAEKRPRCGHPCAAPCHGKADGSERGSVCPSPTPCRKPVRATCPCRRRSAERPCCDNARDYAKMLSALAATKIQEGGSVDLSEVHRPGAVLKTLECDEECRMEARSRQVALALQIRNPDVSAKLAPRYSDHVRGIALKEPSFAQQIHDKLTDLVQLAKKSKQKTRAHSFPSMNWQKRQFIHEMCEHFGCEGVAYDAEPNRNVVATADKEKSWLPAMSVLEVLAREAGKRKVPGPVLRAATQTAPSTSGTQAPPAKTTTGWATLTSTNAWAARSQAKPAPPVEKIDYFDNPPDN